LKSRLEECLENLEAHNVILGRARDLYLAKEAERKHLEATLIKAAAGKSHAERVINAQATDTWLKFHVELARLESVYEFQKLQHEILSKEWLSEYAERKASDDIIRKQGA
jgi:hypothetical protein